MLIKTFNKFEWIVIITMLVLPTVSFSASTESMSLDDLARYSDHIVKGKCVKVVSEWSNNKIYTKNTIEVTDNIKGSAISSYVVTTMGGVAYHPALKAKVRMSVSGGISFSPNEEVILFTKKNKLGQHQVVGMSQGKYTVTTDKSTGKKVIPISSEKKIYSEKLTKDILTPKGVSKSGELVIKKGSITMNDFINKIKKSIERNKSNGKSK